MSTFDDAQRDAADFAKLVNEDTDVTTRYGTNPKKSAPKAIREIGEAGDAAINNFNDDGDAAINAKKADFDSAIASKENEFDLTLEQYKESRGFNTKGTFADGFTYELPNDVGLDADGNPWIYNGTLPLTVTAGTAPTSPNYTQVAYGTAAQVSTNTSDTVQSFVDSFALKIFQSPTDGGLTEIQTRTVSSGEVYEVRKTSDDSLATIYSDAAGAIEIVQDGTSNVSDSDGVVDFYIADGDYYIESGGVKSGLLVSRLKPFNNVADMVSAIYLSKYAEGTRIEWQGYYEQSDGGGNWGVLKFGAHTEDGGSIFSIDANTYVEANLKGRISVAKFGAKGDGVTDDTGAFQAALNSFERVYIPLGNYKVGTLTGTRKALIGSGSKSCTITLNNGNTETVLDIDDLYISDLTVSDDGRQSLDHTTEPGVFLVETTTSFHAERCDFLTDRSVLSQVGDNLDARTVVHDCTLQRVTVPLVDESDAMNFFTMSNVRVVDFDLLRTYGVMVGRSCINATFNQLSVGLNNPVIARVENGRFGGLRPSLAGNEVKFIFLQGYNAKVCHNSFNDVFGRHIDILGNYDAAQSNGTYYKSLVANNKIDYTLSNQNIQANDNDEAGSIYCRYADVIITGNHSDFTNRLLTSNIYDAFSVRHGYKSAIIEGNTAINPKGCGINADVSDIIDTDKVHVSIRDNVISDHTNNSRYGIRVVNGASSKIFDSVTIVNNTVDSTDPISIFIGNPVARSNDYTIEALTIFGNWHKNQNKYDTVEFEGYPEHLYAPTLELSVRSDDSGSSSLGVMGNLLSAIKCCEKYICARLSIELDSSVTTTKTITGPLTLSPVQSKELVFDGDNGAGGRIRFYTDGVQQSGISIILDGNDATFDTCIINSDSGTSTTALLLLSGFGVVNLNSCEAQYGEHYVDTRGPSVNIDGGTIDDINLGNSSFRAVVKVDADVLVNVHMHDLTGANNTRLYYAFSPMMMVYDNISVGTVTGVKTFTVVT